MKTRNYLRLPQVIAKYGLCRSSIYERMPKPIKAGRASLWLEDECDAFMESLIATSRGTTAEQSDAA